MTKFLQLAGLIFCVHNEFTATESLFIMQKSFRESSPSRMHVFESIYKAFRKGRVVFENLPFV